MVRTLRSSAELRRRVAGRKTRSGGDQYHGQGQTVPPHVQPHDLRHPGGIGQDRFPGEVAAELVAELPGVREAILRIPRHGSDADRLEVAGHARVELADSRWVAVELGRLALERALQGQELE